MAESRLGLALRAVEVELTTAGFNSHVAAAVLEATRLGHPRATLTPSIGAEVYSQFLSLSLSLSLFLSSLSLSLFRSSPHITYCAGGHSHILLCIFSRSRC